MDIIKTKTRLVALKCRICLGEYEESTMQALFTNANTENETEDTENAANSKNCFSIKIEDCCGIKIRQSSHLPTKVCERCSEFVRMWYNFRQMCLNTQVYLESTNGSDDKPDYLVDASDSEYMEYLYETLQLQSINRYQMNEEELEQSVDTTEIEGECDYIVDYEDIDADALPENELPIIMPDLETYEADDDDYVEPIEVEQALSYAEESETAEETQQLGVKPSVHNFTIMDDEDFLSPTPSPDPKPTTAAKRKPGRPRKPDSELKTKRKSKGDEPAKVGTYPEDLLAKYMCNLCGNVYPKKSAFTAHMTAHTDYKPHQCEICYKSFRQMGELRAHIRRHTGERPYKCLYCDRHFYDRSEKVRHERVHTNTRPYECKECGKTFTHTAILKNHSLVHTGEKNFSCSICSKSFTLLHQLKAHLQTLTHKGREEQANGKPSEYLLHLEDLE